MFDFQRTQTERIDVNKPLVHEKLLYYYEERRRAHAERLHREHFAKRGCQCDLCVAFTPKEG